MRYFILMAFAIGAISCTNQEKVLTLKSTSKLVSIKEGDLLHKDGWTISPEIEIDEFITNQFVGEKKVSFISDIDTLSFAVTPNNIYDFIILLNGNEKAVTRINTDNTKNASIPPKKILKYYYKDNKSIPLTDTIPFRIVNNRIHINGRLNDSDPLDFMFDTGANNVSIKSSIIGTKVSIELDGKAENIGSDGTTTVFTSSNNRLEIGDLIWDEVKLNSINSKKSDNDDGVLGWAIFENKIVEINYDKEIIILHRSMNNVPLGFSKLETKMIGDIPYIKGTLTVGNKSSSSWLEFDTGYNGSFSLSQKFAKENDLNNKMKIVGTSFSSGTAGIRTKANECILPKIKLGEFEIYQLPISIEEKDPEGIENNDILGNNLLKRFNAVIDLQNFEIYLKPNDLIHSKY